jgi:pyruvate-formate lyase-activating enzyme
MDHPNRVPIELEADPVATQVTPTVLEVYFNNTCNLSCLYCIPELSSKINQENVKFGKFDDQGVVLESVTIHNQHSEIVEKFWQWMQLNSQHLSRLHVLGGEPFYQNEFDRCLEYFDQLAHPGLELNVVTNLMIDHVKLHDYLKKFRDLLSKKHLKRIDITCSIDCTGPEQEFVRWGMNIDRWLLNFDMLRQHKWLTLNINQTISVLTIKTMPKLMNWLAAWRETRPIGHFFSVVSPQPSYMDPAILGPGVFDSDFETVLAQMPDGVSKQYMAGIFASIQNTKKNPVEMLKLKTFLNEKDRRRGTNWKQLFPWLAKELEHVV